MNPEIPSARVVRVLGLVAVASVVVHLVARLALLHDGRYFATEDDGYRAYYGYLAAEGTASVIGRFWLPGQFFVLGALGRLGLDAAAAPLVLGAICFAVTLSSVYSLAKDLAPDGWGEAAARGAMVITALSPLVLVLCHSALAEPLSNALVAFAGMALVRRHHGGSRRLVASGALAMLLATWVRYETWAYAAVFVFSAVWFGRRRAGSRVAVGDGAMASLALVGPLGWLLAQYIVHDDPFAFLTTIGDMSVALTGENSPARVAVLRAEALTLWAGAAVALALAALGLARRRGVSVRGLVALAAIALPGLGLQVMSGQGLGVFIIAGREVEFFAPRLVSNVELGLLPLAGLGVAMAAERAASPSTSRSDVVARLSLVALALLVAGLFARGAMQPMTFVDPSSVLAGAMLRRGELDDELAGGALVVERVEPRPPMGWASLSVTWSQWERTIFFTRRGDTCELVEPSDVRDGRARIPCTELAAWAEQRGVSGAWVLSEPARETFAQAWPDARVRRIGEGTLLAAPRP